MHACGANFGSLYADNDVPAVAALPYSDFAFCKNFVVFDVFKKRTITFLVMFFDSRDKAESCRKRLEALFFGVTRELLVHIRPFVVFALGCGAQIFGGVAYSVKLLKPEFCVFLFVFCGFQKQSGDLLVALFFCNLSKVRVLVASLRFAGKRSHEIFLGSGSRILVILFHNITSPFY